MRQHFEDMPKENELADYCCSSQTSPVPPKTLERSCIYYSLHSITIILYTSASENRIFLNVVPYSSVTPTVFVRRSVAVSELL